MNITLANLKPEISESVLGVPALKTEAGYYLDTVHYPIGLGLIAASLASNAYDFEIFDTYASDDMADFLKHIEFSRPDVLLMGAFLGNYSYAYFKHVVRTVKNLSPETRIVLGGPMATTIPEILVANTDVDYLVLGEGELAILDLLRAIKESNEGQSIPGIYAGKSRGLSYGGTRDRLKELCLFPLYEPFDMDFYTNYIMHTNRCWEISSSRGCWNNCAFCKITFGRKLSTYPADAIVDHLHHFQQKYGISRYNFVDDNFLNRPERVKRFLTLLKERDINIEWRAQGRMDNLDIPLLQECMEHGLFDITFGMESGSQRILDVYQKHIDLAKHIPKLQEMRGLLSFHGTFIVGAPGETWEDVELTAKLIRDLRLQRANVGFLTLFPKTKLYNDAISKGVIADEDEYLSNLGPLYTEYIYTNVSSMSDKELYAAREYLLNTISEQ